jgi:hypothetical protein
MKVQIDPHTLEKAEERGTNENMKLKMPLRRDSLFLPGMDG